MIAAHLPFPADTEPPRFRELARRAPGFRRALAATLNLQRLATVLPKNPARRAACRIDAYEFGRRYFMDKDWDNDFLPEYMMTLQDAALVDAALTYQKAVAAPRGIGKTTAALIVVLWAVVYGHVRFVAILSASQTEARDRLETVKHFFLSNDLIHEDFPELTGPVRECNGDPRRAQMAGFEWSKDEVVCANGIRIIAEGLQGPVRGLNKHTARPDFVLLDDIEDEDSVKSKIESKSLDNRFRNEVMGLGESGKRTIFLYLCTLISRKCISAKVTDPEQEPQWRGMRYRALITEPEDTERWERFQEICRGDASGPELDYPEDDEIAEALGIPTKAFQLYVDPHKAALRYYHAHRAEMDAGAVLLDPRRRPLHDLYTERATRGEHYWLCEIQQTPPEDESESERVLDVPFLRGKESTEPTGIMPRWGHTVICSVDLGQRRLHWEMDAWDSQLVTSQVCRIGQESTRLDAGALEMAEQDQRQSLVANALRAALDRLRVIFHEGLAQISTGEIVRPALIVVDCGGTAKLAQSQVWAWHEHVLRTCQAFGTAWRPVKGAEWTKSIADRARGRNWIREDPAKNPYGRLDANADFYKTRLMDAYEAPARNTETNAVIPGTRLLHAAIPTAYMLHQTAEKLQEKTIDGKPIDRAFAVSWVKRSTEEGGHSQNHWFDTGWLNFAAADYLRHARARPKGQAPRRNRALPRKEY